MQVLQAAPPEPHALSTLPGWQFPPESQQPPSQVEALQTNPGVGVGVGSGVGVGVGVGVMF